MAITYISFREFVPYIQLAVQSCPVTSIINAVRDGAIAYCRASHVWKQDGFQVHVVAGTSQYEITAPDNTDVSEITLAKYDGDELDPLTEQQMKSKDDSDGSPYHYTFTEPLTLNVWPTPEVDLANGLVLELVLQPKYNTTQCPEFLLARHREAIVAKAKALLMMIPNKPWTDPGLAAINEAEFRRKSSGARVSVAKGGTRKGIRPSRKTCL